MCYHESSPLQIRKVLFKKLVLGTQRYHVYNTLMTPYFYLRTISPSIGSKFSYMSLNFSQGYNKLQQIISIPTRTSYFGFGPDFFSIPLQNGLLPFHISWSSSQTNCPIKDRLASPSGSDRQEISYIEGTFIISGGQTNLSQLSSHRPSPLFYVIFLPLTVGDKFYKSSKAGFFW